MISRTVNIEGALAESDETFLIGKDKNTVAL
jgi:hypothetical protein